MNKNQGSKLINKKNKKQNPIYSNNFYSSLQEESSSSNNSNNTLSDNDLNLPYDNNLSLEEKNIDSLNHNLLENDKDNLDLLKNSNDLINKKNELKENIKKEENKNYKIHQSLFYKKDLNNKNPNNNLYENENIVNKLENENENIHNFNHHSFHNLNEESSFMAPKGTERCVAHENSKELQSDNRFPWVKLLKQENESISETSDNFDYNVDENLHNSHSYGYLKNKFNLYCMNCGKKGHTTKKCNFPIISIGIICIYIQNFNIDLNKIINYCKKLQNNYLFESEELKEMMQIFEKVKKFDYESLDNHIQYLMICRKNSLSYVDFMRGKYDIDDYEYLHNTIYMMTEKEQQSLLINKFEDLWLDLWSCSYNMNYSQEYEESKLKFDKLKYGYLIQKNELNFKIDFQTIINSKVDQYTEPEWGFPKGRRNSNEKNIDCAKREFQEETGLKEEDYHILNLSPLEELYMGSNHIRYKHIYYLGQIQKFTNIEVDTSNQHQLIEIGDIRYLTFKDGYNKIRKYHIDKKNVLHNTHNFIIQLILNFKSSFDTYYQNNIDFFNL